MLGATLAHAEGALEGVGPGDPLVALGRVLGWGRIDVDLDAIGPRGELRVDRASARGGVDSAGDGEAELASTGVIGDCNLRGVVW